MCRTATLLCGGFLLLAGLLKCEPTMEQRQLVDETTATDFVVGEHCWYICDENAINSNGTGKCELCNGPDGQEGSCCRGDGYNTGCSQKLQSIVKGVHPEGHYCIYEKGIASVYLPESFASVDLPESCKPCSQGQLNDVIGQLNVTKDQVNANGGQVNANSARIFQLEYELALLRDVIDQVNAYSARISQLESELAALGDVIYPKVALGLDNGETVTLVKLPLASGYSDDQAGMDKYVAACHGYGAYPIGCGTSKWNCPKSWNGCVAMPSSWGCSMLNKLHEHTGWDNVVTLDANPAKGNWYLKEFKGSMKNPTGSDQLHAVCAL